MIFIEAQAADLDAIVAILADDELAAQRESYAQPLPEAYHIAFEAIHNDPRAQLIIVKEQAKIIAVAQINFLTYLTYHGGVRAQIEGVRVHRDYRSQGVGRQLFNYLIKLAREHGCHLVQLTTDKQRPKALDFYISLGFQNTHNGFKLRL